MESTPSPRARMTISVGLKPWGPSTYSSAAWDPKNACAHTPLVHSQTLEGLRGRDRRPRCSPLHPNFQ